MDAQDQQPHPSPEPQENTADVLIRCLEAENVEYVFGIPGEERSI